MVILRIAGATLLTAAGSCATPSPIPSPVSQTTGGNAGQVAPGAEFRLQNGESAVVGGTGLVIRFAEVPEDARCAVGATCSDEGDALVSLVVERPATDRATLQLHTHPKQAVPARYGPYRIELIRLEPLPVGEQHVPLPRYFATLRVSTP